MFDPHLRFISNLVVLAYSTVSDSLIWGRRLGGAYSTGRGTTCEDDESSFETRKLVENETAAVNPVLVLAQDDAVLGHQDGRIG